jgi:hypothetical protein
VRRSAVYRLEQPRPVTTTGPRGRCQPRDPARNHARERVRHASHGHRGVAPAGRYRRPGFSAAFPDPNIGFCDRPRGSRRGALLETERTFGSLRCHVALLLGATRLAVSWVVVSRLCLS